MSDDLATPIWLDGAIVQADQFRLHPHDEGLLYGRGVFTTLRTFGGAPAPWMWERHLARLLDSAHRIGFPLVTRCLPSLASAAELLVAINRDDAILRINATAGTATTPGSVWIVARPLPPPKDGYRVGFSDAVVAPKDPWSELKTFNYGVRLVAYERAVAAGFDDALLFDPAGNLLEASRANIFVRLADRWLTPPLTGGVVAGVVRGWVLEREFPATETVIRRDELAHADAAFLTNSGRGIMIVDFLVDRPLRVLNDTAALAVAFTQACRSAGSRVVSHA